MKSYLLHFKKIITLSVATTAVVTLSGCSYFAEKAIKDTLSNEASIANYEEGLNVFLCGTGTPYPDEARNPSCVAVVAGTEYLVFDAGEGASRRLDTMGLPTREIDAVFLTHWHSDHFSGLGYLINSSWVFGRNHALDVFGPEGAEAVLEGIRQTYAHDTEYRSGLQKGELKAEFATARATSVKLQNGSLDKKVIYNKNGVVVSAFLVDHAPVEPALGYMVEYEGRKIVISGDTRIAKTVEKYANNADLLIHEALNVNMNKMAVKVARELGLNARADQIEAIIPYHASTLDIARLAERTNVNKLVLTHFIPGPSNWLAEQMFTDGMDDLYSGDIIIGEDKMQFNLSPVEQ